MNWWIELSKQVNPTLQIGPLALHYYGLIIAAGMAAAVWLAQRRVGKYGLKVSDVESTAWHAIIGGLVGARLYHVWDYLDYYRVHLTEVAAVWQGGLGIYGGLIGGVAALMVVGRWRKLSILKLLDVAAPAVALAQGIGRWGNFFNQEAYGPPTQVPWKIFIDVMHRLPGLQMYEYFHPTFLYESLWNLVNCGFLLWLEKRFALRPGQLTGVYLIIYGLGRLMLELWRLDTAVVTGVKVAQVLSLVAIGAGLWLSLRAFNYSLILKNK